jgi:dihydrofolate reductase
MRKLTVNNFISLDGVVQAPGYPDEDTSGGFERGGWNIPYVDDVAMKWLVANVAEAGGFLLGRGTYEYFAGFWPNAGEDAQALAGPMNTLPKYVASTTLNEPLAWQNATLLTGNVVDAVAALKQEDGSDLRAIGSPRLAQTLIENDLVDEFRLMIDPLVLGAGKRLFADDGSLRKLQLVESQLTTTGAILATYTVAESSWPSS